MTLLSPSIIKKFNSGNQVRLLTDHAHAPTPGEDIFVQVETLVSAAKTSVCVEMYELDQPQVVDLLAAKARAGIAVRVVTQPPDQDDRSRPRRDAIRRLEAAGAQVKLYPVKPMGDPQTRFGQLDHVKLLVVDGQQAILGGMNWGSHSPCNHDYDVLIEGPIVADMARFFAHEWQVSGGLDPLPVYPPGGSAGTTPVHFLTSGLDARERTIGRAVHRLLDTAQRSIHAELFVLTERQTIQGLIRARARGVDVRIILHPLRIGQRCINEDAARQLQAGGVDVRWYHGDPAIQEKLHAKMATLDDNEVILGSANWSYAGFNVNREADVELVSRELNAAADRYFRQDWEQHTTATPIYAPLQLKGVRGNGAGPSPVVGHGREGPE